MRKCKYGHEGPIALQFAGKHHPVRKHGTPASWPVDAFCSECEPRLGFPEQSGGVDIT